jgi:molybdopterin-binding protein
VLHVNQLTVYLLTELCRDCTIPFQMANKPKARRSLQNRDENLLKLRDAALELCVSFPTIKQWIYKRKIRSVRTAGGHHRIPQTEIDRFLFRTRGKTDSERTLIKRRVSGRNQLVGRIDAVRISGLMAEVKVSIGDQQITSIITASSAREMNLKAGQTAAALIKATEVMILRV